MEYMHVHTTYTTEKNISEVSFIYVDHTINSAHGQNDKDVRLVAASLVNSAVSRETSGHSWSKVMALWNVISEITNDVIVINAWSCNTSLTPPT